jgi:hypothetical protein
VTDQEMHALLGETEPPYTIATRGGREYQVTDRANVWAPELHQDMLCVAVPGKGIVVLRTSAIESLHIEHDTLASSAAKGGAK